MTTASRDQIDDGLAEGHAASRRSSFPSRRELLAGAFGLAILAAAVWEGKDYWQVGRFLVGTNDAYIEADATIMAPKVAGYIDRVAVEDNQTVKAGQLLAVIDDRDYLEDLDQAKASVAAAEASVSNLAAQIDAQQSLIREAEASVSEAQVTLALARRNDARRRAMAKVGFGTIEQADNATSDATAKAAAVQRLQAASSAARQQVAVLTAQRELAAAKLKQSRAMERQAELNLGYTKITAPIDGYVAARTVRQGQYVQAGTQLMAVVPLHEVYVIANYKETQLSDVRPGQPARITVDTFPGDDMAGHVGSLAPAAGLVFSLLPPDNATGNFTKIVQRIPVKIFLDPTREQEHVLRPGMSVYTTIDTRPAASAAGRQN